MQILQKIGDTRENHPERRLAPLPTLDELNGFVHKRNFLGESIDL